MHRRASLRLIHSTILMLILLVVAYNEAAIPSFNVRQSRNIIFRAHAHLFNAADSRWRDRKDERLLHQSFPATITLVIAASELHESEHRAQEWIAEAMLRSVVSGTTITPHYI